MENVTKHTDKKLITTEARRNYLVSEPKYHITNFLCENILAIEIKKTLSNSVQIYQYWKSATQ